MPIVFVHGVNVRRDADYDKSVTARDALFRGLSLTGIAAGTSTTVIENPYWGELAAKFYWNYQFLPEGASEAFGSSAKNRIALLAEAAADVNETKPKPPRNQFLVSLARKSLLRAVDCLCAATALTPDGMTDPKAFADFCRDALAYAAANPQPQWLANVKNDDQFAEQLLSYARPLTVATVGEMPTAQATEQFGAKAVWNWVKAAAGKVGHAAADLGQSAVDAVDSATAAAGGAAASAVLNPLAQGAPRTFYARFGLFLGDAFKYIQMRGEAGNEGPIVKAVADAFRRADATRNKTGDPLIIVGHSMGGNISYDILTHYLPNLVCDVFLTVGSQVGLFEELKLFRSSSTEIPNPHLPKAKVPTNIKQWVNVYDPADVFAYRTEPIFDRAKDYSFSTETSALSAHGMYFFRPRFHQRLNARLLEALK